MFCARYGSDQLEETLLVLFLETKIIKLFMFNSIYVSLDSSCDSAEINMLIHSDLNAHGFLRKSTSICVLPQSHGAAVTAVEVTVRQSA